MRTRLIVPCLGVATAILVLVGHGSTGGTAAENGPWDALAELFDQRKVVKGLERAAELASSQPAAPQLRDVIFDSTTRDLASGQRPPVEAAARQLVRSLAEAYRKDDQCEIGLNLYSVTSTLIRKRWAEKALADRELMNALYGFEESRAFDARVYLEFAGFLHELRDYRSCIRALRRADLVVDRFENAAFNRLLIAEDRAEVLLALYGHDSLMAVTSLHRVVRLDESFSSHANWALCRLGSIALGEGKVEQAKTYLALAARVKVNPSLVSYGFEKSLAFDMIDAGYPEEAIKYLAVAFKAETSPSTASKTAYALGLAHLRTGDRVAAKKWLTKCTELSKGRTATTAKKLLRDLFGEDGPGKVPVGGN